MKVAIVYDSISDTDTPDARDVMIQADVVARALAELGHTCFYLPCTLNLLSVKTELARGQADMVFNLVESIGGHGRLIHLLPFCLDALAIPYTGARAEAMLLTSGKVLAKNQMRTAGIPTPAWIGPWPGTDCSVQGKDPGIDTWIIKSVWEHASIGLNEQSIVKNTAAESIFSQFPSRAQLLGGACFAEQFINGREFNLSVLGSPRGPQVLPPAEILFKDYTDTMPRIVDYRAKWDESAFAYHHTPRHFNFSQTDKGLLKTLSALALDCWNHFGLCGYARVDFRVDPAGHPWVLEINANPCLAPDAGFAAALEHAGITKTDAIGRIIADALPHNTIQARPFSGTTGCINPGVTFRKILVPGDGEQVHCLVDETGFFNSEEVLVARELVLERLDKGEKSGYDFIMADHGDRLVGYACFGPIPCTASSYDLYWIAVHPKFQACGLGQKLLSKVEDRIRGAGGTHIYVDTSQRAQYTGTRAFYERCGYRLEAVLQDFYAQGDGKAIYSKSLI